MTWEFNPFIHNVVKWSNILLKSCEVYTARFLKYFWPFYSIMHERVKLPSHWIKIISHEKSGKMMVQWPFWIFASNRDRIRFKVGLKVFIFKSPAKSKLSYLFKALLRVTFTLLLLSTWGKGRVRIAVGEAAYTPKNQLFTMSL